ncbi:hypothetical protein sortsyn_7 [Escherichia phage sortsyn]|uniref:Recombinase n=1 Tax=Escherichia phage sortsyn TaxID=2696447 RepID=A0A6B9X4Z8_9CAUD|nr:hypothetical protein sortsyn_7 [Escherichia phage sortsyn]
MEFSESRAAIVPAMVKARIAMMSEAKKNTENNHLHNWYADLGSFIATIRPALESNGLIVVQTPMPCTEKNNMLVLPLETMVLHESGEYMTAIMEMPLSFGKGAAAHSVGSAITYARRYHLAALFGITQADDDGNATKKTARQWIADLEGIEDVQKLDEAVGKVVHALADDQASVKVVRDWHITRKAALRASESKGFNPASVVQKKKAADNAPAQEQPAAPVEPQQEAPAAEDKPNIEDF